MGFVISLSFVSVIYYIYKFIKVGGHDVHPSEADAKLTSASGKLTGAYAAWFFIHVVGLFISFTDKGREKDFWTFTDYEFARTYDFSEFLVYANMQ